MNSHHFSYMVTNKWLEDTNIMDLPQFKVSLAANIRHAGDARLSPLMFVLIFMAFIVPTAYLLWRSKKSRR